MIYDVFISYSRKDYVDEHKKVIPSNEVSKIKEALTKAGITYWFDEEGVYSENEFAKVIVRSIKASSVLVFLSTENSNQSEQTINEISIAYMLKKKIIPVRIDSSEYNDDIRLYLSSLSYIDYKYNPEKGIQKLIQSIISYLYKENGDETQNITEEKCRCEESTRRLQQQEEERRLAEHAHRREIEELEWRLKEEEIRRREVERLLKEEKNRRQEIERQLKNKQIITANKRESLPLKQPTSATYSPQQFEEKSPVEIKTVQYSKTVRKPLT